MLTKGAIGNLVNRYRAVLRKCHLLNTFGSLAVASMLVLGGAGAAWGYDINNLPEWVDRPETGAIKGIKGAGVGLNTDEKYYLDAVTAGKNSYVVHSKTPNVTVTTSGSIWLEGSANKQIAALCVEGVGAKGINTGNIYISAKYYLDRMKGIRVNNGGKAYNEGLVYVKSQYGMYDQRDGVGGIDMINGVNGVIISEGNSMAYGMAYFGHNTNTVRNDGLIVARNSSAKGVLIGNYSDTSTHFNKETDGENKSFTNNGTIYVVGTAYGIESKCKGTKIINNGNIIISANNGIGVSFSSYSGQSLLNNGTIQGKGTLVKVTASSATLENSGLIAGADGTPGNVDASHDKTTNFTLVFKGASNVDAIFKLRNDANVKVTGLERDDQQLNLANAELGSLDVANSTFTVNGVASGENPTALKIGKLSASEAAELNLNSDSVTVTDSFSVASGAKVAAEKLVLEKTGVVDGGELTADTLSLSCDTVDLIKSVAAVNELDMQAGTLAVEESDVTVGTLTSAGGTVGLNKSVAAVDTLDMQGGTLNIIDSDVTIGTLKTAGGTIFIDPSNVKVGDLEGKLDADFFIGEGSTVDFGGADMSSAPAVSDKTAVLALGPGKSIEVDKGSLEVNGALTGTAPTPPAPGTVKFAADSLFVVDGATEGGVIRGSGGALTVEDGAKLHINNARVGEFVVASNFDPNAITVGGWNGSNLTLTTSNVLTEAVAATPDGDDVIVSIVAKDAASVFPDLRPVRNVDTMMAEGQNDTSDDAPAGIRMLSRALEKTASPDSIDAVNEASSAAVTVGVQNTALRIADAASNTVIGHLSLAQHDGSRAIHADGADFWAAPMYGNLYTSGMAAGGQSVRGQFGGLALGADVEAGQFLGGKFRIGASINGGGGQSETSGTATSAQNDYDFGGLNFYAGWNNGALNLMASVGYAFGNHEVEMGLPASLGMSSAKADVDTAAFTADLRAEYQLKTGWLDVLPHVGVRYTALRTDAHDLKSGGEVLNSVERDTQNIVQFPIGVTLSRDFDLAGWALKPAVDLSFIPAAGDKDARTSVNFSGIDAVDSFDTRIMDSTSWAATVGVQAEKGAFSLGLNYGVQASSHETDQNVQLKLGWKF